MPTNTFIIKGGRSLSGVVSVNGSKNAALPILAATLLTRKKCVISNVPRVLDVFRMVELLKEIGSLIRWRGTHALEIENKNLSLRGFENDAVEKMRASILLVGPLLARFGKVEDMRYPGGCSIGSRSIDTHLRAFQDLGARVNLGEKSFSIYIDDKKKLANFVTLEEFSVTATESVLIFLSAIPQKSYIRIAASEPHVKDLTVFLSKMGAIIEGGGTSFISVRGKSLLKGVSHKVTPDYIEAGTFLLLALLAGEDIIIKNVPVNDLDLVIKKLFSFGANLQIDYRNKIIKISKRLSYNNRNRRQSAKKIQVLPYPGIPTDLQSSFAVLATQIRGDTLIHEPLYEKRLESLKELEKMGAFIKILDPHRAIISGPAKLRGAKVNGLDIRTGAALIIAGLIAKGNTRVHGAEYVERGYEDIVERLRLLGADIERI